jgi:hypothetical protein
MSRFSLFVGALAPLLLVGAAAQGAPFTFDAPGDVVLSPTQAPGTWYTDRYAPAGFASGQVAPDGRLGTLQQGISASDASGLRPAAFSSAFYNTQGRKYDFVPPGPGLTSAFIDMYVSQSWDSLNQNVAGAEGRLGSLWATGFTAADVSSGVFPIIEFNNNADGMSGNQFRVWDPEAGGSGWQVVGGFAGFDRWYEVGFLLNGSALEYYVNGVLVYTDLTTGSTTQFGNLILQGYNAGNSYDIYWDNLRPNGVPTPEPASLAVWSLLTAAGAACCWRRRRISRR